MWQCGFGSLVLKWQLGAGESLWSKEEQGKCYRINRTFGNCAAQLNFYSVAWVQTSEKSCVCKL